MTVDRSLYYNTRETNEPVISYQDQEAQNMFSTTYEELSETQNGLTKNEGRKEDWATN